MNPVDGSARRPFFPSHLAHGNGPSFPETETEMIGSTPIMRRLFRQIATLAPYDVTILLQGETGTGKELVARSIHQKSSRAHRPFITVCCTALCDSLVENELFGHEKGGYTGAMGRQAGGFERADKGTLFLDEIGAASPLLQERLLRVLQERTFLRVGGQESVSVDIRLIAATHTDLRQAMREERFREDLFYRLHVVELVVPPLRDRMEDIPELVEFFLKNAEKRFARKGLRISGKAMDVMRKHDWPGNVRELKHAVERAVLMADSSCIGPEPLKLPPRRPLMENLPWNPDLGLHEAMACFKSTFLQTVLTRFQGNVSQTARHLRISRRALYGHLQRCGIDPQQQRPFLG